MSCLNNRHLRRSRNTTNQHHRYVNTSRATDPQVQARDLLNLMPTHELVLLARTAFPPERKARAYGCGFPFGHVGGGAVEDEFVVSPPY